MRLRDDDDVGFRVASRLGLEATEILGSGGAQGPVYRLSDGRVLKVSFSAQEAAGYLMLMKMEQDGILPGTVARTDAVLVDNQEGADDFIRIYAIIREDIADVLPPGNAMQWHNDMDEFKAAWRTECHGGRSADKFMESMHNTNPQGALIMAEVLEVARFLNNKGLPVCDVSDVNIGVLASGYITIRDIGACTPSPLAMAALETLECVPRSSNFVL